MGNGITSKNKLILENWGYDGDGWEGASANADFGTEGYTVFSCDADGNLEENVCEVDDRGDDEESEAIAKLISQAPRMARKLIEMLNDGGRLHGVQDILFDAGVL